LDQPLVEQDLMIAKSVESEPNKPPLVNTVDQVRDGNVRRSGHFPSTAGSR
jgi:hypothetical protein